MDYIKFPKSYEQSNKTPSPVMSRKQVMEHFGIGSTTLHRWTQEKELQKIVDDYCVKFSWNYKGSLQFQKEEIGDGVELTREEIVNKVLGVEFDLIRWINDFDYYMKFFHENKSVNHIITYGYLELSNELTDELMEFSKSGKKGKEMEKLDWLWDNFSSIKGYDENTGEELKYSDEEVQEVWDLNYEEITTGWRYPHKFDQHKTVKEVFMTKDYQDKSEKYLQSCDSCGGEGIIK